MVPRNGKKFGLLWLLMLAVPVTLWAQTPLFTTIRVGDVRLGMSQEAVNSITGSTIKLKALKRNEEMRDDTVFMQYQSIRCRLCFLSYYDEEVGKSVSVLESLYSEDANIQTKSGIKSGDDKFDILKRLDGYHMMLSPDEEKGKEYSKLEIYDTDGYTLCFFFKKNILYAMELTRQSNEC